MKADGMPGKLVNPLKSYYSSTRMRVRVLCTRPSVTTVVSIQVAPHFFIRNLEFVDDIAVPLKQVLCRINDFAKDFGQEINTLKTKVVSTRSETFSQLTCAGHL